jgi:hypothetical protein
MKVTMLPLDNRPVTYLWPQLLAKCAGIEALAPPRAVLGSLDNIADFETISAWLTQRFADLTVDYHLLCLDTVLYGGLIPARRSTDTQAQIEQRLHNLFGKPDPSPTKERAFGGRIKGEVFIQSSIMRISDNYDATEEKDYWRRYGREIFSWSEIMHRLSATDSVANGTLEQYEAKIPVEVRNDYLQTRRRNFAINRQLVELVPSQRIQKLVLSQDDSGTYGLNVLEKERLSKLAQSLKAQEQVTCYAGADEVLETLLANALVKYGIRRGERRPKCTVHYSSPNGANQNSRYEGQKISESVENQIRACGVSLAQDHSDVSDIDFIVVVHTSENVQGDHIVLSGTPDLSQVPSRQSAAQALQTIESSNVPVVICDVAYTNGGDPQLVEPLLSNKDLIRKIWGYAGWNTAGNTIGSSLAMAVSRWFSNINESGAVPEAVHKQALLTRLLDDWAYQAVVRAKLAGKPDLPLLNELMEPHVKTVAEALDWHPDKLQFTFPWNRTFEIELVFS